MEFGQKPPDEGRMPSQTADGLDSILLVEDSQSFATLLTKRLHEALPVKVVLATTLAQTRDILVAENDRFILAVLDLNLPDASGGEIVDLVLAYKVPVIVFTGVYEKQFQQRIFEKGVLNYFIKDNVGVIHALIQFIHRIQRNRNVRILVVDDSRSVRLALSGFLSRYGFQVDTANDGQQALTAIRKQRFHLVISDYRMPNMDGVMLMRKLRAVYSPNEVAAIGLSMVNDPDLASQFLKAGANDFLVKPFQPEELLCRVEQNVEMIERYAEVARFAELHQMVTDHALDAIITIDHKGQVLEFNPAAERLFGFFRQRILGQRLDHFIVPKDRLADYERGLSDLLKSGQNLVNTARSFETKGLRVDGELIDLKIAVICVFRHGQPTLTAFVQDVTERKRDESRANRSFQSRIALSALLETSLEPLSLHRQLEVALEIIMTVPWLAIQHKGSIFLTDPQTGELVLTVEKELSAALLSACARIAPGHCLCGRAAQERAIVFSSHLGPQHEITFDGIEPHGHYCVPIIHQDDLMGVLNLYLDDHHVQDPEEDAFMTAVGHTLSGIIRHRRLEQTLEQERRFSSAILDTTGALVVVYNPDGCIKFFNSACQRVTGYALDAVVNRPIWECLLKAEDVQPFREMFARLLCGNFPSEDEHHWLCRDGRQRLIAWSNTALVDDHGAVTSVIATGIDVTERRQAEARLQQLAHHDSLTGLPNRALFFDLLALSVARARRDGQVVAVFFLDLDRFKAVNDTLGHEIGDLLLMDAAKRLRDCVREGDVVARLGGDEFTLILPNVALPQDTDLIAQRVVKSLCTPFILNGHDCQIGSSIGISLFPDHHEDPKILLKMADAAMYQVKANGRNHFRYFQPDMAFSEI